MKRSEKNLRPWSRRVKKMLQDENLEVMDLGEEVGEEVEDQEEMEELEVSNTEDEEEQECSPLFHACCKGMTEVVERLLRGGADMTLCNCSKQTALHLTPPELQARVLGWMWRPHLPRQAQLLQAAWQGDLISVRQLLTDEVEVNAPNRDGVTPLMLAVRDINLFEGMTLLPWEHRPVEVVKELLRFSPDLWIRDHSGCSALHYAAGISSPLKEEIIRMIVEALSYAAPVSPLAPAKYSSCQDSDSELADLDLDLDLESLYTNQSTSVSPNQTPSHHQHFLLDSHTGERPESAGCLDPPEHLKGFSQDKGIPPGVRNAMETLTDVRQAHPDKVTGSRGRLSLPSLLSHTSRQWSHVDPPPSSGPLTARRNCLPVPPKHRQRTRSLAVSATTSSGLLSVAPPSKLSQSAPTIMEPLLGLDTVIQARAHIQTRLGSHAPTNEQKFSQDLLSALHPTVLPQTPKLLAPLDRRPKDSASPPVLKHRVPLKPIRTLLRREKVSGSSSCTGPLTAKGGSEESSSSSSSQSSINLEDEENDRDIRETTTEERHLMFIEDRLLKHSKDLSCTQADNDFEVVNLKICFIPPIPRLARMQSGETNSDTNDNISNGDATNPLSDEKANTAKLTKEAVACASFIKCNYAKQDTVSHESSNTLKSMEEMNDVACTEIGFDILCDKNDDATDSSVKQPEETVKDSFANKTKTETLYSSERQRLNTSSASRKTEFCAPIVNHIMADMDPKRDKTMVKVSKPVRNKGRATSNKCDLRANTQANQSFNILANKDRSILSRNKSRNNLRYSAFSTQVKDKARKSPELSISGEAAVASAKPKLKSVKAAHHHCDTPSPRKKGTDHLHKRANPDKVNNNRAQQHPTAKELKSNRQLKRPAVAGTVRSKSAVDVITYKDMFKQIQSGDEGPAIYEMFAGPVYDRLRASSSCEKVKDRPVQSAPSRQSQQTHKVMHRPLKQAQNKMRKSPAEVMVVSAKSKAKPVSCRPKPQVSKKGTPKRETIPKPEAKLAPNKDIETYHDSAQENIESYMLSTIEEALSGYSPDTLKTDDKTLTMPARYSLVSADIRTQTGNGEILSPQSPQQPKIDTWTYSHGRSLTIMSPVYQKFLDEVGDGPLTDDLLQCLAEELISLDERDVSIVPCPENLELSKEDSTEEDHPVLGGTNNPEVSSADSSDPLGCGLFVDDTITWTKGEILGRGAYGTVYCGLTSQGQLIAVKQVSLDPSDPDAAKREYSRLQGEVELLKTFRHTNIVGFLGTSLYKNMVSIFMEYVPGGSIASILHRFGPLPECVLALYTHQILEGVAFLHLNRVIHRDLKGNNVMLMPTGVIKLIDFGCARRLSRLNHTASNSGELLRSVHGTPYWMAPEVINETGYGRKSDIWSVGCTVFEMATGKPPLAHMDKLAALFYIGAKKGLMPSLPDGFSDSAKDFVRICLTSDQTRRPSADQLLKHSFIPKNETCTNSGEKQKTKCCSHPDCG